MSSMYRKRRFLTVVGIVLVIITANFLQNGANFEVVAPDNKETLKTINDTSSTQQLAAAELELLAVKGRSPKTGYTRAQFGEGWRQNGECDTRNDILSRDLINPDIRGCKVYGGTLNDPYTGKSIQFIRGAETSDDVQIDHIVALSDAWQKGAQALSFETREAFANDPLELLAVEGVVNQQKGDGDAATWLPPNKDYRCRYVARQIAVKRKYSLWVTGAEKNAMKNLLDRCPGQLLPQ